jgi:signal transduction histidine kinase
MTSNVVRCPACGEVSGGLTCAACGVERPTGEVGQIRDQAASDRDETAESRDRAAELRDRDAEDRDELARGEEQAASDRHQMASDRDQKWSDHDQTSSGRDQRSADADQRSADDEFAAGGDAARYHRGVLARERSRKERGSTSGLRSETTAARLLEDDADTSRENSVPLAERDRANAADDRADAADDREEAARERADAFRDRTEFGLAAERALETLESMSDAFQTLDSEWRFTYLNLQCEAILDRRREDLLGKKVWDEFPEAVGTRFYDEYHRAVREQTPVRFEEFYEPLGRTLQIRAYPITTGLAVYFIDVTEERLRDARLRQTERLEMLGRLTAGVAHDFNNLLAAIGGFAKLGQADSVDEKITNYFDQIDFASQKAAALTRQLLAFGGQQDLAPEVIDLNDVVKGISSLMRQLMPDGVELRLAFSPQPVAVVVDRSQLEQVVLNLVVNSRDAIDTTGSITVSTTPDAPAGVVHDVRVSAGWLQVTDTGSGIPEDVLPHIFDPFFTTKPPETGTGLGLATIYGIVTQSGGCIIVDSTVGVGTTFTIALPAGQSPRP